MEGCFRPHRALQTLARTVGFILSSVESQEGLGEVVWQGLIDTWKNLLYLLYGEWTVRGPNGIWEDSLTCVWWLCCFWDRKLSSDGNVVSKGVSWRWIQVLAGKLHTGGWPGALQAGPRESAQARSEGRWSHGGAISRVPLLVPVSEKFHTWHHCRHWGSCKTLRGNTVSAMMSNKGFFWSQSTSMVEFFFSCS